jgi:excisionase family DNA binding protein
MEDNYSNLPDLMTVREVAKFLRVSPLTIKRWGKKGKLSPIRINSRGDRRYTKQQVLWLIGKGQKNEAPEQPIQAPPAAANENF